MPDTAPPSPPHAQLIEMGMAHWVSTILYVTAKLSLPDHLAAGAQSADALATTTKTDPPSLYRFLRTLASLGLVTEEANQRFTLTPLGAALKTGAPGAARPTILTLASPWWMSGFHELLYSVQTGKSGFEKILGKNMFDYLADHPEEASLFSETMVGFHGAEPPAVAAAYDFSQLNTVIDVGGATGNLLSAILAKHPSCKGILYDLPHVVKDSPALIQSRGLSNRVQIQSGSFFDAVPPGGDAYLLSHVIHDWPEDKCLTILGHIRRAMKPTSRLLIIEMVLPEGNTPHPGKLLDIMMLVGPGGRERTQSEYADLLKKANLRLNRVVPTESAVSVVEAVLA